MILVPDSAHGTNPASAAMAGFTVKTSPPPPRGWWIWRPCGPPAAPDTAGLMLTNPNTVGLFEKDILELTALVHAAGGLVYYDGANLNAIMGVARPGDMGFDVCHLNLHKTFATPTAAAARAAARWGARPFWPLPARLRPVPQRRRALHRPGAGLPRQLPGGRQGPGLPAAAGKHRRGRGRPHGGAQRQLSQRKLEKAGYTAAFPGLCMHEFVLTLEELKRRRGYPPWTWPSPCWTRASTRPPCISP